MAARSALYGLVLILFAALANGCGPVPAPPKDSPEDGLRELHYQQWLSLAQAGPEAWDAPQAAEIAAKMAAAGPNGLEPLLALLEDPAAKSPVQVCAYISLTGLAGQYPEWFAGIVPRLLTLTQPNQSRTARGCATQLLGEIDTPEAQDRLRQLLSDDSLHVRFTAVYNLLLKGDPEAIQVAALMWKDPALNAHQRTSLVLGIPATHAPELSGICVEAVKDKELAWDVRGRAIEILGRAGGPEALPVLEECAQDPDTPNCTRWPRQALA